MKPSIIETHVIDKHDGGGHSFKSKKSGLVQSALDSDFPEPDERFFPKVKARRRKKSEKNSKIKLE